VAQLFFIQTSTANRVELATLVLDKLSDSDGELLHVEKSADGDNLHLAILFLSAGNRHQEEVEEVLNNMFTPIASKLDYRLLAETVDRQMLSLESQENSDYIITLMSDVFSVEQIFQLIQLLGDNDVSICAIENLSGVHPANEDQQSTSLHVEFHVSCTQTSMEQVRRSLHNFSNDHLADVTIQAARNNNLPARLVVFDMDSTLIDAEVIDELALEAGVGQEVAAITESAMRGEIDFQKSFSARVALLEGLSAQVLQSVADRLQFNPGAETLINRLKRLGFKTAIISGGFGFFAQHLKSLLGIDYIFANQLDIADGVVTGKVVGDVIDGVRKAQILREIAAKEGLDLQQVVAVGDGANDLPMLEIAGLGIAYKAKPVVRARAKQSLSHNSLVAVLYILGHHEHELM
jgi:phosphoserine phosphatase